MILRLAWKALTAHPVRAAVLGVGFGLGVGVMAILLGVGAVVLEQARAPALAGGGQLVIVGATGAVTSARYVMTALRRTAATLTAIGEDGSVQVSPRKRADLYLVRHGRVIQVRARGGIPSLERQIGDPETAHHPEWIDTAADSSWANPAAGELLRAMDRFHPIPDVPARTQSWAEWLYFKGQTTSGGSAGRADVTFYCSFVVGPKRSDGRRAAGVRLQLDRGGAVASYSDGDALDESALLASAPDVRIGRSQVRLEGSRYHVTLDLPGASADFSVDGASAQSLPPFEIRGAAGWVTGYTVPVMSGPLTGVISPRGAPPIVLSGSGYHDHNWGFWEGVSWRWGQVQHEGRAYLYGRVFPPADAADPERLPGFLMALGPEGPLGFSTRVTIDETDDPVTGRPRRIVVRGRSASLDLTMDIAVEDAIVTRGGALAAGPDFLQLRTRYHVTGRADGRPIDFSAPGASETFRGGR
jgi:hypothetical protein